MDGQFWNSGRNTDRKFSLGQVELRPSHLAYIVKDEDVIPHFRIIFSELTYNEALLKCNLVTWGITSKEDAY